jgi:hypothetical protein
MSILWAQAEKQFQLCAKFVSPSATILGNVNLEVQIWRFTSRSKVLEKKKIKN